MAVIRNLVVKIGADISGLSRGLKSAQKHLTKVSKEMEKVDLSFIKTIKSLSQMTKLVLMQYCMLLSRVRVSLKTTYYPLMIWKKEQLTDWKKAFI